MLDRSENPRGFDPVDQELTGGKYTILETMTDGFDMDKAKENAVRLVVLRRISIRKEDVESFKTKLDKRLTSSETP